jgi:hypothetical protein
MCPSCWRLGSSGLPEDDEWQFGPKLAQLFAQDAFRAVRPKWMNAMPRHDLPDGCEDGDNVIDFRQFLSRRGERPRQAEDVSRPEPFD